MNVSLTKRAFFKGRLTSSATSPIRPPWAVAEEVFLEACSACDKCVSACEQNLIERGDGGYPHVNFKAGACTFCQDCVSACPDGALVINDIDADTAPWHITATISADCLSAQGITCRICGDLCDIQAIRFKLAVGGVANPTVDAAACSGCGACVQSCPSHSITMIQKTLGATA